MSEQGLAKVFRGAFKAHVDDLQTMRVFAETAMRELGLNERAIDEMKVCVDEAATNIVAYGYAGKDGEVELEISRERDEIVTKILDRAPVFDPSGVPAPDLDQPLHLRPVGGLGVHLIRTLSDGMSHGPRDGGGNETVLRKRIHR